MQESLLHCFFSLFGHPYRHVYIDALIHHFCHSKMCNLVLQYHYYPGFHLEICQGGAKATIAKLRGGNHNSSH